MIGVKRDKRATCFQSFLILLIKGDKNRARNSIGGRSLIDMLSDRKKSRNLRISFDTVLKFQT